MILFPLCLYLFFVILIGCLAVVLSTFSLSLGIRSKYTELLIKIFTFTEKIVSQKTSNDVTDDENDDFEVPENFSLFSSVTDEVLGLAQNAAQAISADLFTESQNLGDLPGWNMLTRTDQGHAWSSPKLTVLWTLGFLLRWGILLPVRSVILLFAMLFLLISSVLVGLLPEGKFRTFLDRGMNSTFFRLLGRSVSLSVEYKNPENRPKNGSICVANHTSPLDIVVLANDNYYSLVGQKHPGFLGSIENALQKVSQHIWFDRFQAKDRQFTKRKLTEHALNGGPPIMVFPEGVCVNNTIILKFRKGAFDIGVPIYPVTIKYDRRFGDPFWIQDTWAIHHMHLMTDWAIRAEVTYLPMMTVDPGEHAVDFAMRVKRVIADTGGLRSLEWDGTLKYLPVGMDKKGEVQREYAEKVGRLVDRGEGVD